MTEPASAFSLPAPAALPQLMLLVLTLLMVSCQQPLTDNTAMANPFDLNAYPVAARKVHQFEHHGEQVTDPYAWLRDPGYPEVTDPEILSYLQAENAYFDGFMAPLQPLVEELFSEMKGRQPIEDSSVPYLKNGYWYQWRYGKDAQYRVWYRASAEQPDNWQVLLDETALAAPHDYFRLGALAVSPDGTKLAYSTDIDGSERFQLRVIDIASRQPLTSVIPNTMGNPVWSADSNGLLYVIVSEQWRPYQVYHRKLLGNLLDQAEVKSDKLVLHEEDSGFFVSIHLSQSEELVIVQSGSHTTSENYFIPRADLLAPPTLIAARRQGHEYHVDHGRQGLLIRSNHRQANFDLYQTSLDKLDPQHWRLLVEGDAQHYLTGFLVLADYLLVEERIEGLDQIRVVEETGQHYIEFPEAAYEVSFATNANFATDKVRLHYTSLVTPGTVFDYHLDTRSLETLKVTSIPSGYTADDFVTRRLSAPARDGAAVPVSVVYHKNTPTDGSAPLYLYGYGAYGHAIPPSFSPSRISLLERGFIYAIAHIRGGDDLGYHWYTQGKLQQRTNTFNDFVDAAQHLIEENLTQPGRIAIAGGSAGGELMGAVVNQAPQLWGAVAAHVPFVDVLNTILDETLPLTPIEWDEWGNPIKDPEAFAYIRSYSPYDQLRAMDYPPMLVTAGLQDPRVTYWEPAKYVARIRHLKTDNNPLLLKTNMEAGHGGQSGRFDSLRERAEEFAFMVHALN